MRRCVVVGNVVLCDVCADRVVETFAGLDEPWEQASTQLEACESCHEPLPELELQEDEQMEVSDVR